mmetsp:Transcript_105370/g.214832  ORF Transcript_105370/g.214832 Transcript_105370/m.214832 type:complete len:274 (-) Transcript_105370:77-898(-)
MKPGTRVRIKGLVKASKHNGKTGLVTKASAPGNGRRVGVKLQDGSGAVLAIKIENLDKLEESPAAKTPKATTPKTKTTATAPTLPKERTLKRDNALLREFDGNPDPNVLVLYYHFGDRAFDCFNASEYNVQMLRYYEKGLSVKLIVPRKIGNNEYFLVGLQHAQHDKNTLCEVAFNCGRSFAGITMLVKKRCFACHKPLSSDSNNNNNNNNNGRNDNGNALSFCCERCLCVCFCDDPVCLDRHASVRSGHKDLCKKIDLTKIVVEKECVQLLL